MFYTPHPTPYSAADLVTSFVKVNIDDEVFEQAQLIRTYQAANLLTKLLTATLPLSERLTLALHPTPKQEDADNTPSECVYDEFTELVARM